MKRVAERNLRFAFFADEGFALPSILFLIIILSMVAGSVLEVQYLGRQVTLRDIAKVKAEYAAESGIARSLALIRTRQDISGSISGPTESFTFSDGSRASVTLRPWGVFLISTSVGKVNYIESSRTAIAADRPSSPFSDALLFANPIHQLVLAGNSSINGPVVLGQPGVTVGNLKNYSSPVRIPIDGSVTRQSAPRLPYLDCPQLDREMELYRHLLATARTGQNMSDLHTLFMPGEGTAVLRRGMISDSINHVFVQGDLALASDTIRRSGPLYLVATGDITLRPGCEIEGLIAVLSYRRITVMKDAFVDQSILFGGNSIQLDDDAKVCAQLIAPSIVMKGKAQATYPSALISIPSMRDSMKSNLEISLEDGSRVEGLVALVSPGERPDFLQKITIHAGATVVGGVYSNAKITLDGTVLGTVMTKDFYFYDAPTTYFGWVRSGTINRAKLPAGFLVPPGFSDTLNLEILDWICA